MLGIEQRRLPRWVAILAAFALAAVACGGEEPAAEETAEPAPEEVAAATEDVATEDVATEEGTAEEATQAAGESCVEGETVTFVVSFGAGGGYDFIARTLAPYLEQQLGASEVIVENRPGAGGLVALKNVQAAEPDGTTFGFFSAQGIVGSVIGGAEGADFDLMDDFSWVGRVAADQRVLSTPGMSEELQSIEDVMAAQGLQYGTSGPGGNEYIDAVVLTDVLGLDTRLIVGFEGSAETELALTSGDIDITSGTIGSRLGAIESGDHNPVLILSGEPADALPDVPVLLDMDLGDKAEIAQAYVDLQEMGRMVWAPAGVPEACLEQLTNAFETVLEDEAAVSQLEAADQEVDWARGEEMRETAQSLLDAPQEFTALLEQGYQDA